MHQNIAWTNKGELNEWNGAVQADAITVRYELVLYELHYPYMMQKGSE